ncbi:MAG: helix-turn-helix transcriptional regulator [Oceanospirillaceae bacterium]|uniref:LuxR C-terminal-related transcriptional regulator n=1 Tax=unclassified Thalassolituus TaxID=2624967 RepID=UPI000C4BC493|nr:MULTISPECIES: LuxR C-terminal-related transcriptional regulator [unclassified Thalassolituus]MAS25870.1 helix-turn-helix transcriptional regulator [Oceanospirillaceae bacterium]MAX98922.1 helix-turn-helix transcriptional regulator [Oceanospirillaceae bacterium]MBL34104.1 helix-turn-helix transcriptional regulator [Oceanospirillaceae bacterium]MBS54083.1 helix-turn-helix transcriptional regulator [Oceanospirillaceae bacterium]|tara:strand:+ start:5113 stop:5793 length:681 start_codon:yes stop_codon:yes gene_type:complete
MDRQVGLPGKRVILFGHQNLQNSILIGYIHQRTNVDCQLVNVPEWQPEWSLSSTGTLALIDADCARPDKLHDLLDEIHEQDMDIKVALFNVIKGHPAERFIAWPMVNGLFYRDTSQQQLSKGIIGLFEGEYWLPRELIGKYLEKTRHKPRKMPTTTTQLTRREKQILRLTATGATNIEIAEKLSVSMHTVKTHIYNLFKKIGAANRIQAVNWAKEYMEELLQEPVE